MSLSGVEGGQFGLGMLTALFNNTELDAVEDNPSVGGFLFPLQCDGSIDLRLGYEEIWQAFA